MITRELMKKWGIRQAVHVERLGRGVYEVSSRRRHDVRHQVDVEHEPHHCACEDFERNLNKKCFHWRYVMMLQEAANNNVDTKKET